MTLEEARKRANPRLDSHICNCKGSLYFLGPKPPHSTTFRAVTDREVVDPHEWKTASQSDRDQYWVQDQALGALLAHCYNHFDEVVKALDSLVRRRHDEGCCSRDGEPSCDCSAELNYEMGLLARAKEVKSC
jgi:hypothetical protein